MKAILNIIQWVSKWVDLVYSVPDNLPYAFHISQWITLTTQCFKYYYLHTKCKEMEAQRV